jgi:protein phosphatase
MSTETLALAPLASGQLLGEREAQEDALATQYVETDDDANGGEQILVLADGMGGHVGGATASNLAVSTFLETYLQSDADIRQALRSALDRANEDIALKMEENPEFLDMGTTLIGAVVCNNHLYWISVGDSPLWLYRNGELQRLNADHSMVPVLEGLVEIGRLTEDEAANDTRRNHLRSAVTGEELTLVDLCPEPASLQSGDLVLLASDGVETLSESELVTLLNKSEDEPTQQLVGTVLQAVEEAERPEQDNASLILYRYG